MKSVKIFLLDFDSRGSAGTMLREIVGSASHPRTEIRLELISANNSVFGKIDLVSTTSRSDPNIIFLVLPLSQSAQACETLQFVRKNFTTVPIIVIGEVADPAEVFELLKQGANDFITVPLRAIDVLPRLWRVVEQTHPDEILTESLKEKFGLKKFIGESAAFVAEIKKIPVIAKCSVSVLISGETGTGKELYARALHYLSPRKGKPFIPVNCGAIPLELLENELFGHDRGAYTSATTSRIGLIGEADGGILFLDEIDCLPLLAQVKLLRFLQEKEYRSLGSTKMRQADVRVIAAANTDFEESVRTGKLRQDLYHRLNVIPIKLPPLRERREDIPLLARHFLRQYAVEFAKVVSGFSPAAMHMLMQHRWPGNVRELEHAVERAVVLCEQTVIEEGDIALPHAGAAASPSSFPSFQDMKAKTIEQFERHYIQELLQLHEGNITRAAQAARKNRRAFWQLIRKHQIDVQSIKSSAS